MSFMHGAQDGQKFIGVLFLGVAFCNVTEQCGRHGDPGVADGALLCGYGGRHQRRW